MPSQKMLPGAYGMDVAASQHRFTEREILTMRLLGRLEFMLTSHIKQTVYRDLSRQGMEKELRRMIRQEMIWSVVAPASVIPHTPGKTRGGRELPMRPPNVYGLTNLGKLQLEALSAEPHGRSFESLKSRDPKGRPPSRLSLPHDIQVAWYCANILESARRSRYIRSVYIQTEYVIHERQRIDALIVLRVGRTLSPERNVNQFPLYAGSPRATDEYDIVLALEVDRNTEQLKTLVEKGETYRDLTVNGTYHTALGAPVLPVFVVPTGRRAAQIARGWRKIWPNGWGIISTPYKADDPEYGVLWGAYLDMITSKPMSPLTSITYTQHSVQFGQMLTREQWIADQVETGVIPPPQMLLQDELAESEAKEPESTST